MLGTYIDQLRRGIGRVSGRSRSSTLLDMIYSSIRWGISPNNYVDFGFDKISSSARKTYITYRLNQELIRRFNDPGCISVYSDKMEFARVFGRYMGRECMRLDTLTDSALQEYLVDNREALLKPRMEGQGRGVQVVSIADLGDQGVLTKLRQSGAAANWLLDQRLQQHEGLTRAFGPALAALRVVTILTDVGVRILFSAITLGVSDLVVNYHRDGLMAPVDIAYGKINGPAIDKQGNMHSRHPSTGQDIVGFEIPLWDDVLELVHSAAVLTPGVRYVGWDVAITGDGPVLIEGNHDPGTYSMLQRFSYRGDDGGLKHLVEDML